MGLERAKDFLKETMKLSIGAVLGLMLIVGLWAGVFCGQPACVDLSP